MAHLDYDYHSLRARKARVGVWLQGAPVTAMSWLLALLIVAGLGTLFLNISLGWVLLGLAAAPFMLVMWYHYDLRHLPTGRGEAVTEILSGDILGQLPAKPSPADVALATGRTSSGQFMGVRLGLSPSVLQSVASHDAATMPESLDIWYSGRIANLHLFYIINWGRNIM